MSTPTHPSNALAQIAGALYALECSDDDGTVTKWLEYADEILEREAIEKNIEEWTLPPSDLLSLPEIKLIHTWPPEKPENKDDFLCLIRALQALDRWHRPLTVRSDSTICPPLSSHEEVRDNLFEYQAFGRDSHGVIIPASWCPREEHIQFDRPKHALLDDDPIMGGLWYENKPVILRLVMTETIYIPNSLQTEDADNKGITSDRRVNFRYYYPRNTSPLPTDESSANIIVGIAPMLQTGSDACLDLSSSNDRYGVRPTYNPNRINEVLALANKRRVELLLFPEMSISEENLPRLAQAILETGRASNGELPTLRYVFAGVWAKRAADTEYCKNYTVLFDSTGQEILRQHKLHHWNLTKSDLQRYGYEYNFPHALPPLFEDILPAKEVVIADLPGLGRIATLICADINFNTPGDWMLSHLKMDWLHMPIMDHSTVIRDNNGSRTWISRRAQRAAYAGHGRVMVTNSMVLTKHINAENIRTAQSSRCFTECGIGFMIDAAKEHITYAHIRVPMLELNDEAILECVEWGKNWLKLS